MEKNGNYISVDKTLMVLYIFALLDSYDKSTKNGTRSKIDPYRDTLYMKTDEQKYVEVPNDLRK